MPNRQAQEAPRRAWLRAPGEGGWWRFARAVGGLVARRHEEVAPLLAEVERAAARGLWAVGFVAYEAAPGLDPGLSVAAGYGGPFAVFGLFREPEVFAALPTPRAASRLAEIAPELDAASHAAAVAAIRAAIGRGETYQVNFTFPLRARLAGRPEDLFAALARAARSPHAAFLDCGRRAIVSLSPELFFERLGERLRMRPMKGTRRRGRFAEEDQALAAELLGSEKDRAENLMIVDMVRHDLGRVSRVGSVAVESLFDLERYPTVWQLTSTVAAESAAPLPDLFAALFPCASVTGAPKRRTMEWIARLEGRPRGAYCGAIGWVAPGGRARFAVAIRTAEVERASGTLAYGVGSGVVWDSDPAAEYAECLAKGAALAADASPFRLLETCRWSPEEGIGRCARHLARLADSAAYFDFVFDAERTAAALGAATARLPSVPHRLRLALDGAGEVEVAAEPLALEARPWRVVLAAPPVDSSDRFLCHKTTRRAVYERAFAAARACGADEALLVNERGELTEGTRTNLVLTLGGRKLTPARSSGLLAGVFRAELLARGEIEEAILTPADLARAERIDLINSLRGWIPARLESAP